MSDFAGGDGTLSNPYQIENIDHLFNIGNHLDKNFILNNDIDMIDTSTPGSDYYNGGAGWTALGSEFDPFTGNFNGAFKKIKNLSIDVGGVVKTGIFAAMQSAEISNIIFEDCVSASNSSFISIVAGNSVSSTYTKVGVNNCVITGLRFGFFFQTSNFDIYDKCFIKNSIANKISSTADAGGFRASGVGCTWDDCYVSFEVIDGSPTGMVGGFVHRAGGGDTLNNCYSSCIIPDIANWGSIIGNAGPFDNVSVSNCFFDEDLTIKGVGGGSQAPALLVPGKILGKPTSDMKTESTFTGAGWDFTPGTGIWQMGEA